MPSAVNIPGFSGSGSRIMVPSSTNLPSPAETYARSTAQANVNPYARTEVSIPTAPQGGDISRDRTIPDITIPDPTMPEVARQEQGKPFTLAPFTGAGSGVDPAVASTEFATPDVLARINAGQYRAPRPESLRTDQPTVPPRVQGPVPPPLPSRAPLPPPSVRTPEMMRAENERMRQQFPGAYAAPDPAIGAAIASGGRSFPTTEPPTREMNVQIGQAAPERVLAGGQSPGVGTTSPTEGKMIIPPGEERPEYMTQRPWLSRVSEGVKRMFGDRQNPIIPADRQYEGTQIPRLQAFMEGYRGQAPGATKLQQAASRMGTPQTPAPEATNLQQAASRMGTPQALGIMPPASTQRQFPSFPTTGIDVDMSGVDQPSGTRSQYPAFPKTGIDVDMSGIDQPSKPSPSSSFTPTPLSFAGGAAGTPKGYTLPTQQMAPGMGTTPSASSFTGGGQGTTPSASSFTGGGQGTTPNTSVPASGGQGTTSSASSFAGGASGIPKGYTPPSTPAATSGGASGVAKSILMITPGVMRLYKADGLGTPVTPSTTSVNTSPTTGSPSTGSEPSTLSKIGSGIKQAWNVGKDVGWNQGGGVGATLANVISSSDPAHLHNLSREHFSLKTAQERHDEAGEKQASAGSGTTGGTNTSALGQTTGLGSSGVSSVSTPGQTTGPDGSSTSSTHTLTPPNLTPSSSAGMYANRFGKSLNTPQGVYDLLETAEGELMDKGFIIGPSMGLGLGRRRGRENCPEEFIGTPFYAKAQELAAREYRVQADLDEMPFVFNVFSDKKGKKDKDQAKRDKCSQELRKIRSEWKRLHADCLDHCAKESRKNDQMQKSFMFWEDVKEIPRLISLFSGSTLYAEAVELLGKKKEVQSSLQELPRPKFERSGPVDPNQKKREKLQGELDKIEGNLLRLKAKLMREWATDYRKSMQKALNESRKDFIVKCLNELDSGRNEIFDKLMIFEDSTYYPEALELLAKEFELTAEQRELPGFKFQGNTIIDPARQKREKLRKEESKRDAAWLKLQAKVLKENAADYKKTSKMNKGPTPEQSEDSKRKPQPAGVKREGTPPNPPGKVIPRAAPSPLLHHAPADITKSCFELAYQIEGYFNADKLFKG